MLYTKEQEEQVEKLAKLLFSISEIAIIIDVDKEELKEDIAFSKHIISRIYHLAKFSTLARMREQEIEMAELGSNTAIEIVKNYAITQKLDE
jgi:hypothetical protein